MSSEAFETTHQPVAMAVVGYGHFGRIHADKIAQSRFANLVAVADVDPDRAAAAEGALGVKVVRDHRELLGTVQAVSIVVPTVAHYEIAEAFLRNGVDVLVEKPITDDPATARKLVEIARAEGRLLQVGHLERFTSVVETLRGVLYRPLFIDSVRIAPFQLRSTDVNVILDLMIHDLDLVLSFVDAPIVSIEAAGTPVFSPREDIANARIRFANGCIASITASRISQKTERKMRIFQPDRYVNVDFAGKKILTISKASERPAASLSDIDIAEAAYQEDDPLNKELRSFAAAVANRTTPEVTGEDGLRALEAAIMINESMRSHAASVERADAEITASRGVA